MLKPLKILRIANKQISRGSVARQQQMRNVFAKCVQCGVLSAKYAMFCKMCNIFAKCEMRAKCAMFLQND